MIRLENLTFAYPASAPIFKDFSWEIERGETWSILGPSGCGKSTLLYMLAGLRSPSGGSIWINEQLLTRPRPQSGLIIQEYGLLPWATVRQNARLGLGIREFYGPDGTHAPFDLQDMADVEHWLKRLQLLPHADKFPAQLSGGQRQRTAIARTLALKPDLLLMDEPFSSLDAPTREGLQNLTLELQTEEKLTLLVVTHSIEEAVILGEKILLLGMLPNNSLRVIENPGFLSPDFRISTEYSDLCQKLRKTMEKEANG